MKILHIVEASFAGVGRHVLDLAGAQAAAGHDVHVAYSPIRESNSFARERGDLDQITWAAIPMSRTVGSADPKAFLALRRLMADVKPDVVHGHSTKGGLMARLVPNGGAPVVYTPNAVYSMNPLLGSKVREAIKRIERALASRTSVIVAVSPEEQAHFENAIGVDPAKIRLIPNGIQPVEPADPAEVRGQLGIPVEGPLVGFVGRLDGQKAPDHLLEIYSRMADRHPTARFIVVGDGPMRAELEDRWPLPGSALEGRLDFVGEQPGTWAMSAMDLLMLPSRYEGFPYVLIEAAHLGVPIVTTDGACASLLVDGPASIAVAPVGHLDDLARLGGESLDTGSSTSSDPGNERDRRFTIDSMGEAVEGVYRDVLGIADLISTEP